MTMDGSKNKTRRGTVLIYTTLTLTVLIGMAALMVDGGRAYTAKAELQAATDAAARYAATAMKSQSNNTSAAAANATAVFAQSSVDGTPITFNPSTDLTLGLWIPATKTFTPTTIALGANAVRIQTSLVLGSGSHQLAFAPAMGKSATIHAQAIAMVNSRSASTYVNAQGNPWLSGMPNGSVSKSFRTNAGDWDYAGAGANLASSPATIGLGSVSITPGSTIMFDAVTGASNFSGGSTSGNADGDNTKIVTLGSPSFNDYTYFNSPMNGMSNIKAPINSMMAIFLDDNVPTSGSAPSPLDFSTASSRDYTSLSPQLKQVFFVGDGRNSSGEAQQIIVPPSATRMFIGSMDGWQWNNNYGGYTATINSTINVTTVK